MGKAARSDKRKCPGNFKQLCLASTQEVISALRQLLLLLHQKLLRQ
jgi:hypothetical protein